MRPICICTFISGILYITQQRIFCTVTWLLVLSQDSHSIALSVKSTWDDVLFERQTLISHQWIWNLQLQKSAKVWCRITTTEQCQQPVKMLTINKRHTSPLRSPGAEQRLLSRYSPGTTEHFCILWFRCCLVQKSGKLVSNQMAVCWKTLRAK